MRRVLLIAGGVLGAAMIAFAGWYFRPWSDYSPSNVIAQSRHKDRAPIYRSMEQIMPHRQIPGSPNIVDLPRNLKPLNISYDFDGTERTLADYAEEFAITGLMVVRDGEVIFEEYWRGEQPDDRHASWSVAKSFLATMIGIAVKEGRIESIDDPLEKYAPFYKGSDYGKVSLRHLLAMSSGIDFIEDYEVEGSDIRRLFFNAFILNRDIDKVTRSYKQNRPAGKDFDYISTNSLALGAAISGAYDGASLSEVVGEKVFAPLGMRSGTWLTDRNGKVGKELAYCCLNIRLEDFAKFGLLYANKGVVDGEQLLPTGWYDFVGEPMTEATHIVDATSDGRPNGYGHHFWVPVDADGVLLAAGYNGQFVWIDAERNIVMAMTSADNSYPRINNEVHLLHRAVVKAAAEAP